MTCPTIDEISMYADGLLSESEHKCITTHLLECDDCRQIVMAFTEEQLFIKETLESPTLPDHFTQSVLDKVEPYNPRKTPPWKKILLSAAGIILAFGLSSTFSPSFAELIGGLFSSDEVDEGLRIAADAGFTERVDLTVEDQGLTFKVEDVIADSSRVALSYQILNKDGKPLDTYIEIDSIQNEVVAIDSSGKRIEQLGMSWQDESDYGLFEFSLRDQEKIDQLTIKFDLTEIHGKKGNWQLNIPVNLKDSLQYTTILPLTNAETNQHGVTIKMKEARFAPSSNEILYETMFTKEEEERIKTEVSQLEKAFGKDNVHTFANFSTAIQYHLENEKDKAIYYHNPFNDDMVGDSGFLQGTGEDTGQLGHVLWNESFVPKKTKDQLTFILDGVLKTVPADFSVTIKPRELREKPISFEYEGNFMSIKSVEKESEYSLRKSLMPIHKETYLKIAMEGSKLPSSTELGTWILVDEKGKSYVTYENSSLLYEKDKNGHYQKTIDLTVYNLDKIPEEFSLHLISVTRYEEVKEEWEVPLY